MTKGAAYVFAKRYGRKNIGKLKSKNKYKPLYDVSYRPNEIRVKIEYEGKEGWINIDDVI
ncbi:MAG: hypothetical protein GY756_15905, partial [bacterium]|nr:hypothetical protein [bacterium]